MASAIPILCSPSPSACSTLTTNHAYYGRPSLYPAATNASLSLGHTRKAGGQRCEWKQSTARPSHMPVVASTVQSNVDIAQPTDELVEEVKSRLETEHRNLPRGKNGRDDHELLSWFLKDRKNNVEAAVAKLTKALLWRQEFGVDQLTEEFIKGELATGKAYLHSKQDSQGRPVIVVLARKHFPVDNKEAESEKLCVHLIEKGLSQLPSTGDKLLGIFDLRGFTSKNADWKFIKFLVNVFYDYYPKRLGQVLFVDAPFIFSAGWNTFKPLLGTYANLVRFCDVSEVREYFTPDTIPDDFKR